MLSVALFLFILCTVLSSVPLRSGIVGMGVGESGAIVIRLTSPLLYQQLFINSRRFASPRLAAACVVEKQRYIYSPLPTPVLLLLFLVQGEKEDELPEVLLGVGRLRRVDVLLADNLEANEDYEDGDYVETKKGGKDEDSLDGSEDYEVGSKRVF